MLLAELGARAFANLTYLGVSRELFVLDAYGTSFGNARRAAAEAFGLTVYTDELGFRTSPSRPPYPDAGVAILILGDSIAFGLGVEEDKTFAGLLRRRLPDVRVYNASVVGHGLRDYENVVRHFALRRPEIRKVYLVYCLNDLHEWSATEILEALSPTPSGFAPVTMVHRLNDVLRERSKLYLLIKAALQDTSLRYFLADLRPYTSPETTLAAAFEPLRTIKTSLEDAHVAFTVVVPPYEAQLRHPRDEVLLPQRRLRSFLERRSIRFIDALPAFREASSSSKSLFLFNDPMHLSELGHRVIYDLILSDWRRAQEKARGV